MGFTNYIDYLNTLHNVGAQNENAIAEQQVYTKYNSKIAVSRKIEKVIYNRIVDDNITIILTGHAGDGKTFLLFQILKRLGIEKFKEKDFVDYRGKKIFYIKDMSELNDEEQKNLLKTGIENSNTKGSSLIISNTGPLIKNIKKIYGEELESEILEKIDLNNGEILKLKESSDKILVINIARIDNTCFIKEFLEKLIQKELIDEENIKEESYIYNNIKLIKENFEIIAEFITNFYRYCYENDNRFTIRQIIAHIAYSITGNLTYENSIGKDLIDNNIFNLFFGYEGERFKEEALQIRGIRELKRLELDSIVLPGEENFFVNNSFKNINFLIKEDLETKWKLFLSKNNETDLPTKEYLIENKKIRKMVRRAYMLFNTLEKDIDRRNIYNSIYSSVFVDYLSMKYKGEDIKSLKNILFDGLFKIYTGFDRKEEKNIFITLKKDGYFVQNVQLIIGKLDKKDLKIKKEKIENNCEEIDIYKEFLCVGKDKIELNLPMIDYFFNLKKGILDTNMSPQLNHGIDRIKYKIYEYAKNEKFDEEETSFLVLTSRGTKELSIDYDFDDDKFNRIRVN